MDKILKVFVAKNFLKLACLGVGIALVACDSGDSSSTLQIAWENSCSSAELVASSGDAGLSSGEIVASSNSVEISSSSGWFKKGDFLNPDIEYGTLVDTRDGKTYSTVVIGDLTWMAENLNYADSVQDPILKGATRCIDERDEDCNVLGRLYDVKVVTEIDSSKLVNQGGIYFKWDYQGICPDGWKIPSYSDWQELWMDVKHSDRLDEGEDSLGVLISRTDYALDMDAEIQSDWKALPGTDLYGFSALPIFNAVYIYSSIDMESGCCNNGPVLTAYNANGIFGWSMMPVLSSNQMGVIRCVKGKSVGKFRTRDDLLNPNLQYDTLVDARDGQIYRTYNGIMAENLNYDDGKAICYNYDEKKCSLLGRMYGIESLDTTSIEGPCPEGWRLPYVNFYYMDKGVGWSMYDVKRNVQDFDYNDRMMPNAFPMGYFYDGGFWEIGSIFAFWGVAGSVDSVVIDAAFGYNEGTADGINERDYKMPIRCVEKDRYGNVDGNQ